MNAWKTTEATTCSAEDVAGGGLAESNSLLYDEFTSPAATEVPPSECTSRAVPSPVDLVPRPPFVSPSDTAAALASTALSALRSTVQPALDSAQSSYDHSLLLLTTTTTRAFTSLQSSDTALAKALVTFLSDDRVQDSYAWFIHNLPILILGLVVYRSNAWLKSYVLRQTDSRSQLAMDFGLGSPSSSGFRSGFGAIEVQWGKEKLRVPLPPPASPLSTLKATLFNMTGVPPSHMKLISSGALLKDDLTSLETYGLVDLPPAPTSSESSTSSSWDFWSLLGRGDSTRKLKKIIMLGSKETSARVDDRLHERRVPVQEEPVPKVEETEEQLVKGMTEMLGNNVDQIIEAMEGIERWLARATPAGIVPAVDASPAEVVVAVEGSDAPPPAPTPEPIETPTSRTLIYLSEGLLQLLLKLDSLDIPSTFMEARKARKEGVRKLQGALDRLDIAKEQFKARQSGGV